MSSATSSPRLMKKDTRRFFGTSDEIIKFRFFRQRHCGQLYAVSVQKKGKEKLFPFLCLFGIQRAGNGLLYAVEILNSVVQSISRFLRTESAALRIELPSLHYDIKLIR